MRNMKIKVETDELGESNLDEIVVELERLGFKKSVTVGAETGVFIYADKMNNHYFEDGRNLLFFSLTTLAELKDM